MIKSIAKSIKSTKSFVQEVKSEYNNQTKDLQPLEVRKSVVKGIATTAAEVRKSGHTIKSLPERIRQELKKLEE